MSMNAGALQPQRRWSAENAAAQTSTHATGCSMGICAMVGMEGMTGVITCPPLALSGRHGSTERERHPPFLPPAALRRTGRLDGPDRPPGMGTSCGPALIHSARQAGHESCENARKTLNFD